MQVQQIYFHAYVNANLKKQYSAQFKSFCNNKTIFFLLSNDQTLNYTVLINQILISQHWFALMHNNYERRYIFQNDVR